MKTKYFILTSIFITLISSVSMAWEARGGGGWRRGDYHTAPHWHEGHWSHTYYHGHYAWWWVNGGNYYFYNGPVYPYPVVEPVMVVRFP